MSRRGPARRRPALALGGGLLAGLAAAALSARVAVGAPFGGEGATVLALIGAWWLVLAAGAACLLRAPRRAALVVVLAGAVLLRGLALLGPPVLSDDLHRYAWDGRVQAAGIDPYRYAPLAPQLDRLHEPWLWPDAADCASGGHPPGCVAINRPEARTIYPPGAQLWFRAVYAVVGVGTRDTGWQLAGLLVDLAVLAVMLALLRAWGRDPRYVVLYAWSPVAVLEATQNAHVDGLAMLAVLGALAAARRRPALAGGLLGVATLVKLYPALLLVALLRSRRAAPRVLGAFAAVVALGYLPHVLAVGPQVLGYLPGYLHEEHYAGGERFLALGALGLGPTAAEALAVAVLAGTVLAVLRANRGRPAPDVAARRLLGVLLLVATPVQPWYALGLAAVAALEGAWWWLAVAAAGYPLFFRTVVGEPGAGVAAPAIGRWAYGAALAVVAVGALRAAAVRRRRSGALARDVDRPRPMAPAPAASAR